MKRDELKWEFSESEIELDSKIIIWTEQSSR